MSNQLLSGTKATSRKISAVERHARALELRKLGLTYQQIADQLGYAGNQGAYKAIQAALRKTIQEPADELRQVECLRLDLLLKENLRGLLTEDVYKRARATEVCLGIMDRRAKLLGLDAPKKVEDTHTHTITFLAQQLAAENNLNADELVAEAQAILATARES